MEDVEGRVLALLAAESGLRAAVVALGPGGTTLVSINPDGVFHAASTMKLPVLVELYRRVAAGTLRLSDTLAVRTAFRSIADGSGYVLDAGDDSERGLYGREGEDVTLRELAWLMITRSSNVAANMLVDLLGADAISSTMAAAGAPSLRVLRGVEDGPAHALGLDSTVTAAGLATLLEALALGRVVSAEASAAMIAVLADQAFNTGIPAGLPAGIRIAHKTGSITRIFHDAGIVLDGHGAPWVIVVLTEGLEEELAGPALVAAVTRVVEAHLATAGGA